LGFGEAGSITIREWDTPGCTGSYVDYEVPFNIGASRVRGVGGAWIIEYAIDPAEYPGGGITDFSVYLFYVPDLDDPARTAPNYFTSCTQFAIFINDTVTFSVPGD
jgi:hypothetical protein